MGPKDELSLRTASSVQEAIDSVVQTFDHPERLSVQYSSADGEKVTTIEIEDEGTVETFELQFQADQPDEKPVLKRITG